MKHAEILQDFKPLFTNDYTYFVFYGGRGGGKSESIAQALVILALTKTLKILCIREVQSSIKDSSKSMLEKWIDKLELTSEFKITNDSIIALNTGSSFIFKGLQSSNAVNVKSITGVNITWIEEAESISKRSWELLVPSVTREKDPKIIISFNPAFEDDIIYSTFVSNTPPPKSFVKKINYDSNPFFASTDLEMQRQHDERTMQHSEYAHKWLGELQSYDETSLWDVNSITRMHLSDNFVRDNYSQVVVAVDPATTSKDHSNEYGIIVAGKRYNGQIDVIADYGGVYTPFEFAIVATQAYKEYEANTIVVEHNQGGEHIKQVILAAEPSVHYKAVWSSTDKVSRALPISALTASGRVKHLTGQPFKIDNKEGSLQVLERQMRQMTTRGFLGPKGSSPDRVDAYVWAITHLANLEHRGSTFTVFKNEMFDSMSGYDYLSSSNNAIVAIKPSEASIIVYDIYTNSEGRTHLRIVDSFILHPKEAEKFCNEANYNSLLVPELVSTTGWSIQGGYYYEVKDDKRIDDKVLSTINLFNDHKVSIVETLPTRSYGNEVGELLRLRLQDFYLDSERTKGDSMILALIELVTYYFV